MHRPNNIGNLPAPLKTAFLHLHGPVCENGPSSLAITPALENTPISFQYFTLFDGFGAKRL
jgi:hypothetical protein